MIKLYLNKLSYKLSVYLALKKKRKNNKKEFKKMELDIERNGISQFLDWFDAAVERALKKNKTKTTKRTKPVIRKTKLHKKVRYLNATDRARVIDLFKMGYDVPKIADLLNSRYSFIEDVLRKNKFDFIPAQILKEMKK